MNSDLKTNSPLSFNEWLALQTKASDKPLNFEYMTYLQSWYREDTQKKSLISNSQREEYVQLLKDLNFLFQSEGKVENLFLKDIDYNNQEDLILTIPIFAKKLKEIALVLNKRRESIKRAKSRYSLVGSNIGLEQLLEEYILRTFTQRDGALTEIPISSLQSFLPQLSGVQYNFFIEVEELHDPAVYLDSDSSVDVSEYLDPESLTDVFPFVENDKPFSVEDIYNLLKTRFLQRAGESELLKIFQTYIQGANAEEQNLFENLVEASKKYLGEPLYGLTAIRLEEVNNPDQILSVPLLSGNNWFLWPSGFQVLNNLTYNNYFKPISINDSNFIESGATAGTTENDSDLIFSDKNGYIEGAWLCAPYRFNVTGHTQITLKGGNITEFLYPYVGYNINSKTSLLDSFSLTEKDNKVFDALNKVQQEALSRAYYTQSFPNTSVSPLYLNQSNLIDSGAKAADFSVDADQVLIYTHNFELPGSQLESPRQAFAYKFNRTDLPITYGYNFINWPIQTYTEDSAIPVSFTEKDCLPIRLIEVNPQFAMAGAVAGLESSQADLIYKLNNKNSISDARECAWLASQPLTALNRHVDEYYVYGRPGSPNFLSAVNCAPVIDGAIQGSIAFKVDAGRKVSFVWCGPDTVADEVFKYFEHSKECPYHKNYPHDYYLNQDYLNPQPLTDRQFWGECNCHSIHYSPVGHIGDKVSEYNFITDCLFEDVNGLEADFSFGSWKDSRNLNFRNSPQFAFYQLDKTSTERDSIIGYGKGSWRTSAPRIDESDDDRRMILKTGRRYTYSRTSLRTAPAAVGAANAPTQPPYLVVNYKYEKINAEMGDVNTPVDIIIAWDISKSQSFTIDQMKDTIGTICDLLLERNYRNVQIGVVAFDAKRLIVSYLTKDLYELKYQVYEVNQSTSYNDYQTNIVNPLKVAQYLLNTKIQGLDKSIEDLQSLCSNLETLINEKSKLINFVNIPQPGAIRKIILFSDGIDNTNLNADLTLKTLTNDIKSGVFKTENALNPKIVTTTYTAPIDILTVTIGEMSIYQESSLMEEMASGLQNHFNLQKYIMSGDGTYQTFAEYISRRLVNIQPFRPVWRKMTRSLGTEWIDTGEVSDMILYPNDFLAYYHQSQVVYTDIFSETQFFQPAINFSMGVKLDGWNYSTNTFALSNIGAQFGAKPFWGSLPVDPVPVAGGIKFLLDYVPIQQPDVSTAILKDESLIQYKRAGTSDLTWKQPALFRVLNPETKWREIKIDQEDFNLQELLKSNKKNLSIQATYNPSTLMLESFSQYKPARYQYICRKDFLYTEPLFLRNRCESNFVIFQSGAVIKPDEPFNNLLNTFHPTVATVSFPSLAVTEKEVGGYMLPENLGMSTYRGRGYHYEITSSSLSANDSLSAERVFVDSAKYGSRNRGLTLNDQLMPFELKGVDNSWIVEPHNSGEKAGMIADVLINQKFTPYQSSYEILGENIYGLNRQGEDFEFWNFEEGKVKWNKEDEPTSLRKEYIGDLYQNRIEKLLVDKGTLVQWKSDIFGNDFGLYKDI
jgi:hypothetical protein